MSVDPGPFRLGDVGGSGPAVLCVHGLTGMPYEVRPPAEALVRYGFACLGPLLPGHGTTPEELAETPRSAWLDAVLRSHDMLASTHVRVYVLGLSLGGLLALALAARRSVAGVVVLAAPLQLGALARRVVPFLGPLVPWLPSRPAIRDREARLRHPCYRRMPLSAVRELMRLQEEVRRELGGVTAPLRLIFSRRDPTVHPENAELILRAVSSPQRDIGYLTQSGHVVTVDREHEEVARQVVEFLRKLEGQETVDESG